jgi:hypothetical protein
VFARIPPIMPGRLLVFVSACARMRVCIAYAPGVKVLLVRVR